jgi:hypothetical protein
MAAALEPIKRSKPDDPVVLALVGLFSADFIGAGEPIRTADMLIVGEQLDAQSGLPAACGVAREPAHGAGG